VSGSTPGRVRPHRHRYLLAAFGVWTTDVVDDTTIASSSGAIEARLSVYLHPPLDAESRGRRPATDVPSGHRRQPGMTQAMLRSVLLVSVPRDRGRRTGVVPRNACHPPVAGTCRTDGNDDRPVIPTLTGPVRHRRAPVAGQRSHTQHDRPTRPRVPPIIYQVGRPSASELVRRYTADMKPIVIVVAVIACCGCGPNAVRSDATEAALQAHIVTTGAVRESANFVSTNGPDGASTCHTAALSGTSALHQFVIAIPGTGTVPLYLLARTAGYHGPAKYGRDSVRLDSIDALIDRRSVYFQRRARSAVSMTINRDGSGTVSFLSFVTRAGVSLNGVITWRCETATV
jgi:hypothetical protein